MFLTKEVLSLRVGSSLRKKKSKVLQDGKTSEFCHMPSQGNFQCCFCVKGLVRLPGATPARARTPSVWARNSEL